jgi:tetratricopeptide (TPR) repeat protein
LQANPKQDRLYLRAASLQLLLNNPTAAEENLRRILALDPDHAEANYQMGYVLYQANDREAALTHLLKAVQSNPDLVAAHALLGELLLERQQYLRAAVSYRKVAEANPNDPAILYNLGLALWGQGLSPQARSNIELAILFYERQGDDAGADRARELINLMSQN